jgi:hypothetical protein
LTVTVHDPVYVALHILHIVIRSTVVREAQQIAVAVVDVPDDVVTGLFGEDRTAVGEVSVVVAKPYPLRRLPQWEIEWISS